MSSDEDMGSESEYSYHSGSDSEEEVYSGGYTNADRKRGRTSSDSEPYTVLSKEDLTKHKEHVGAIICTSAASQNQPTYIP